MTEKISAPDRKPKQSSGWMIIRAVLLMFVLPTTIMLALKLLLGW